MVVLAQVWSATLEGVEGVPVRVEARVGSGIPGLFVVGLPRGAVREARDRIQSAVRGLDGLPKGLKVTINLAPADLAKDGSALDLAMAMALISGAGLISPQALEETAFLGELGLDGRIHPVRGVLPLALACVRSGLQRLVVPLQNLPETEALGEVIELRGASDMGQLLRFLRGEEALPETLPQKKTRILEGQSHSQDLPPDLALVRGQTLARRALEVVAAGGHSLLPIGPPGVGKSLLARALPGLLPDLEPEASLEATAIHSASGLLAPGAGLLVRPPFRAPHHSASDVALVGGGSPLRPGEVTLAHRGVLFMDELAHWSRPALDALREPLEAGWVDVIRAGARARFPARFQLVAAMNPCPCGHQGSLDLHACTCDPATTRRYQARVSGPLLDRIDLRLALGPPPPERFLRGGDAPSSAEVRERVLRARERMADSGGGPLPLTPRARRLLEEAARSFGLAGRGLVRIQRVASTVAHLEGAEETGEGHVGEALQFRGGGGAG
jgi:magnesium chelatase family protein